MKEPIPRNTKVAPHCFSFVFMPNSLSCSTAETVRFSSKGDSKRNSIWDSSAKLCGNGRGSALKVASNRNSATTSSRKKTEKKLHVNLPFAYRRRYKTSALAPAAFGKLDSDMSSARH